MRYAQIKRRGNPEGINVLSKGDSPFFIPQSLLFEFSFNLDKNQDYVSEEEYQHLIIINQHYLCRKKALDLLARREHSKLEMKVKLIQRKFSSTVVENTIEYVVKKDYLNEFRFCKNFIISKNRKGEGKYLIFKRLQEKGISYSLSNEIYDQVVDYEMELKACIKSILKIKSKILDKNLLFYKLKSKGFHYSIIKDAIDFCSEEK